MSQPSSASWRSPTGPAPPSSPSGPASWIHSFFPPAGPPAGEPFAWLRYLHLPLALAGLAAVHPDAWPLYLVVLLVLTVEWPFHLQLAEGVEIYLPATWTSAAAAYLLGAAVLPVFWLSAVSGFVLMVVLDSTGVLRASGLTAETIGLVRGRPAPRGALVDGHLRHFVSVSSHAVRVLAIGTVRQVAPGTSLVAGVLLGEVCVAVWQAVLPIPGRMAPRREWARFAAALGGDMLLATWVLQLVMVCFLLVSYQQGGPAGFVGASLSTLFLHAVLQRLDDTRRESERRRRELVEMQGELDRRERLALIGRTASTVFHQIARQHGAIGIYAHLLARGPAAGDGSGFVVAVRDHAGRILASVEEANRVIEELLRFGQDRALNLYPQSVLALIEECVAGCQARAGARDVRLALSAGRDATVVLDKHKVLQALGNLLDNAIEASPRGGSVEVGSAVENGVVHIAVRDHGAGVAEEIRTRLFTPFCTTKPDGIGLGLALAKELVEAHGGTLEWRAAAPGAVFVLSLPLEPVRA